jgi:FtsH-binding integral membrane protein
VSWVLVIALIPLALVIAVAYFAMMVSEPEDRSGPLFWVAILLTFALLGLAMYMAHVEKQGPIPTWCWIVVAGLCVVILVLRRFLKWR